MMSVLFSVKYYFDPPLPTYDVSIFKGDNLNYQIVAKEGF